MYKVTWIDDGKIRTVTSPNVLTIVSVYMAMESFGHRPRLWSKINRLVR